jgi:hypothetical protein
LSPCPFQERKKLPCPDKQVVKTYLTPEEYAAVAGKAKQTGLSLSAYAKSMCLHGQVKSTLDQQLILELAKVSADLGRLGGLLKLGMSEGKLERSRGNEIYDSIQELKRQLSRKIQEL